MAPQTRGLSQTIFVFCTTTHSSPRMHSLKKPTNVDTHHLTYRVQVTASGCCAAHKAAHVFTPHRSLDSKKRKNKCRQTVHQARAPTTATTGLKRNSWLIQHKADRCSIGDHALRRNTCLRMSLETSAATSRPPAAPGELRAKHRLAYKPTRACSCPAVPLCYSPAGPLVPVLGKITTMLLHLLYFAVDVSHRRLQPPPLRYCQSYAFLRR